MGYIRACYLPSKYMWNSYAEKGEADTQTGPIAILAAHDVQSKLRNGCEKRWERLITVDPS
jgi:hypothetical protein